MHLIWHIISKDFLRARWLLVGWLSFTVFPIIVGWWVLSGGDDVLGFVTPFLAAFQPILITTQVGFACLIVAWVVLEDRLVGSSLHWLVLPISGMALLTAKAAGLVLMLWGLPALAALPWWLMNGFGLAEVLAAASHHAIVVLPALLVALMLASIASGMGRFIIGLLVFLLVFLACVGGLTSGSIQPDGSALASDVATSRNWLTVVAAVVTVLAVILHQYVRRRLEESLVFLVGGGAVVVLIIAAWKWSFLPETWGTAKPVPAARSSITIAWDEPTLRRGWTQRLSPEVSVIMFEVQARISGLETGEAWTGRFKSFRFKWKDGTVVSYTPSAYGTAPNRLWASARFIEPVRGPAEIFPPRDRVALMLGVEIPDSIAARMIEEVPSVSATVEGYVHRGEVLADWPLAVGAFQSAGPRRMAIVASERRTPLDHNLTVVSVGPAPPPWVTGVARMPGDYPFASLTRGVIFNPSDREEVYSAGRWGQYKSTAWLSARFAGVEISRRKAIASPPAVRSTRRNVLPDRPHGMDEHWLDDARFVWTRTVLVGELSTSYATDSLKLPSSFALPHPPSLSRPADPPEPVTWPPDSRP